MSFKKVCGGDAAENSFIFVACDVTTKKFTKISRRISKSEKLAAFNRGLWYLIPLKHMRSKDMLYMQSKTLLSLKNTKGNF